MADVLGFEFGKMHSSNVQERKLQPWRHINDVLKHAD
jgi:hypothetical protein